MVNIGCIVVPWWLIGIVIGDLVLLTGSGLGGLMLPNAAGNCTVVSCTRRSGDFYSEILANCYGTETIVNMDVRCYRDGPNITLYHVPIFDKWVSGWVNPVFIALGTAGAVLLAITVVAGSTVRFGRRRPVVVGVVDRVSTTLMTVTTTCGDN